MTRTSTSTRTRACRTTPTPTSQRTCSTTLPRHGWASELARFTRLHAPDHRSSSRPWLLYNAHLSATPPPLALHPHPARLCRQPSPRPEPQDLRLPCLPLFLPLVCLSPPHTSSNPIRTLAHSPITRHRARLPSDVCCVWSAWSRALGRGRHRACVAGWRGAPPHPPLP